MRLRLAALSACLLAAGCAGLSSVEPPEVRVTGVRSVAAGEADLEQRFAVELNVLNPNNREISVDGVDFELDLNGRRLARGVSSEGFTLPALGEARTTIVVATSITDVLRHLFELSREEPGQLDYRIRGKLHLADGFLRTIPFDRSGTIGR
jgi:LEA14-like dessication related protein